VEDASLEGMDDNGNIKMNIRINIDNPNPIGAHINEISFKIYYKNKNGELIEIGDGGTKDISINKGMNTIDIPMTFSNDKIMEIASESENGEINVLIDGNANIDAIITSINIPIKFERTIDLTGMNPLSSTKTSSSDVSKVNSTQPKSSDELIKEIKEKTNIEFKKPEVSLIGTKFDKIDGNDVIVDIEVEITNPNKLSFDISKIEFDINSDDGINLGYGAIGDVHVPKSETIKVSIPAKLDKEKLKSIAISTGSNKIPVSISGTTKIKGILGNPDYTVKFSKNTELEIPKDELIQ
jgi:LEA14-like dessication related protein